MIIIVLTCKWGWSFSGIALPPISSSTSVLNCTIPWHRYAAAAISLGDWTDENCLALDHLRIELGHCTLVKTVTLLPFPFPLYICTFAIICYSVGFLSLRTVIRQPEVPESIAREKKPLGYRTYYLCKTAILLFLLHMYVILKYWTWTLITFLPWKLDRTL